MIYAFELGHQPHISVAEILSVFKRLGISYQELKSTPGFFIIESEGVLDIHNLIQILGGTIRIAECIPKKNSDIETIAEYLESTTEGKIHFSLSGNNAKSFALEVKKYLKGKGRSVRYIEPKNSATVIHNNLIEKKTDILKISSDWFFTVGIQDIESFTKRDYDRPRIDSKSGMLPPKLARMMINLSEASLGQHILDPFCGSGTVLTEALSLGYTHVSGSDNSEKAVEDSIANINWFLKDNAGIDVKTAVHLVSATKLSSVFKNESIDAIISEPYMGKPLRGHESRLALEAQAQELKELFIKSFQVFKTILTKNGVAIFIIPMFKSKNEWIRIGVEREIEKIGFEIVPFDSTHTSLLYHRENQFVGREIWKFRKV